MKRLLPGDGAATMLMVDARACAAARSQAAQPPLDKAARAWVDATIKKLTLEQLVGQMIFAPFNSTYLSSDTDDYEALVKLVHETQIGGVIAFGGSEPVPQVMLNNTYGAVVLGQPLELASILNRLQAVSALPLLTSSDFEWGVQMRIAGATKFPRAMAFGAAGDPQLAYEAGKVVGAESRALGVHVDFAPGRRRQQQPAQPGDQHPLVRRGSGARRRDGRRIGARPAGRRHARDAEAFSRPRRHRRRLASRPADRRASARAARRGGAGAVQGRHRGRRRRRDGGAHRAAGDRSRRNSRRRSARR